ncbi:MULTISPECIES: hypothetical protein [Streptomyces]|uniref:hypothetical protein n=1 Tax=Streptomyces TaxID=1883 RepID=UPI001E47DACC|nr:MULTISPECIES: hypothetical protein [Streptomyces]
MSSDVLPGDRGSRRGAEPQGSFGRVAVGLGDATEGPAAVRFAVREAETRGSSLHAVWSRRCW